MGGPRIERPFPQYEILGKGRSVHQWAFSLFLCSMQWGPHTWNAPFLYMKYTERAFDVSVGIPPKKRFENEFMQFQVLTGRESYNILELT